MDQRISVVTLAVADLGRSRAFYEALGWRVAAEEDGAVVAFDLLGQSLSLYGRDDLARDMGVEPERLGTGGATLACNVRVPGEVRAVLEEFVAAGGQLLRAAHEVHWGGTVGYAADPDGHVWEVAHNPFAQLAPDGRFRWAGHADVGGDPTGDDPTGGDPTGGGSDDPSHPGVRAPSGPGAGVAG